MLIHISSLFFAIMGLAVKYLGTRVPAEEMALFRAFFPSLLLLPAIGADWRKHGRGFKREIPFLLLRGVLGSVSLLFYFKAITLIDFSNAALLCYTSPLFTACFATLFLREPVPRGLWFALPMAMTGVVLVVQPPFLFGGHQPLHVAEGTMYGLLSGFSAGGAYVSVRRLAGTCSAYTIVGFFTWVATFVCIPLVSRHYISPSPLEWVLLCLIALLATLGQVFMTLGYGRYAASRASTMNLSMVVFAAVLGVLFLHETPSLLKCAGLALTLGGIAMVGAEPPSPAKGALLLPARSVRGAQ